MAEAPEAHQRVEHQHVECEAERGMNVREQPPDEPRDGDRRRDREHRRDDALPERAAVQPPLEATRIHQVRALDGSAPLERSPLLERERGDDREEVHREARIGAGSESEVRVIIIDRLRNSRATHRTLAWHAKRWTTTW